MKAAHELLAQSPFSVRTASAAAFRAGSGHLTKTPWGDVCHGGFLEGKYHGQGSLITAVGDCRGEFSDDAQRLGHVLERAHHAGTSRVKCGLRDDQLHRGMRESVECFNLKCRRRQAHGGHAQRLYRAQERGPTNGDYHDEPRGMLDERYGHQFLAQRYSRAWRALEYGAHEGVARFLCRRRALQTEPRRVCGVLLSPLDTAVTAPLRADLQIPSDRGPRRLRNTTRTRRRTGEPGELDVCALVLGGEREHLHAPLVEVKMKKKKMGLFKKEAPPFVNEAELKGHCALADGDDDWGSASAPFRKQAARASCSSTTTKSSDIAFFASDDEKLLSDAFGKDAIQTVIPVVFVSRNIGNRVREELKAKQETMLEEICRDCVKDALTKIRSWTMLVIQEAEPDNTQAESERRRERKEERVFNLGHEGETSAAAAAAAAAARTLGRGRDGKRLQGLLKVDTDKEGKVVVNEGEVIVPMLGPSPSCFASFKFDRGEFEGKKGTPIRPQPPSRFADIPLVDGNKREFVATADESLIVTACQDQMGHEHARRGRTIRCKVVQKS